MLCLLAFESFYPSCPCHHTFQCSPNLKEEKKKKKEQNKMKVVVRWLQIVKDYSM